MSDREESPEPQENGSHTSGKSQSPSPRPSRASTTAVERKGSHSPQHRSHSRSRSYSRTYSRRHGSYSRSRSGSHSRRRRRRRYSHSHSHSVERRYSRSRSRSYTSPRRSYSPKYYSPRHSPYHNKKSYGGYDRSYGGGGRNHSRSYSNRRHLGNRDNPSPNRCLGVFGLSLYTQERELKEVFSEYGHVKDVQVVYDAQSGRSRGFAFVYFDTEEDAKAAKEGCNGIELDGRKIRVDFSITQRPHTPTPGIYMGKPTYSRGGGGYRGGGGSYRNRSPSPYCRRYSRSRSYSPRKYGYY